MFVLTEKFNETRYDELAEVVKNDFYGDSDKNWTLNRPVRNNLSDLNKMMFSIFR